MFRRLWLCTDASITNDVYVNHLTKEKVDSLIEDLKQDKMPEFESIIPPQMQNS